MVNDGVTGPQPQMKAAGLSFVLWLWNQETSKIKRALRMAARSPTPSYISTMLTWLRQLDPGMLSVCKLASMYKIKHICGSM